jgi:hypothetical protein
MLGRIQRRVDAVAEGPEAIEALRAIPCEKVDVVT